MTPDLCRQCNRPIRNPVPEKWAQRYPQMAGLCRDCAFEWITANLPEDRPQVNGSPGWLEGMEGGRSP